MNTVKAKSRRWLKLAGWIIAGLVAVYMLLLIPDKDYRVPFNSSGSPFVWDQDRIWDGLEAQFQDARSKDSALLAVSIDSGLAAVSRMLEKITGDQISPRSAILDTLEFTLFRLASNIAASTERLSDFIKVFSQVRYAIKGQSQNWDMENIEARHRIYRLLYGGRAAAEEIMLQGGEEQIPALVIGYDEPSATPQAEILGIKIHSGDILVSRGGAPTSALIARGNDYPGNFSHVALAYIDENTGEVSIIESHIESGVGISTIDDYINDTKLRVMVLRLRSDLPQIKDDPLLPHMAARTILEEVNSRHIPYDFEMNFEKNDKYFCSEVASAPYRKMGVGLWMGISRISSLRLRTWLAGLGVRHFETQEPSDLEYDPQLRVVAEWRDPKLLYKDHLDNAALDVMLEGGDSARALDHDWYMLPPARILKGYSLLLNLFDGVGPIPEGMSATAGLRVDKFSRKHKAIKTKLQFMAEEFRSQKGYAPPYWALVRMAVIAKTGLEHGNL